MNRPADLRRPPAGLFISGTNTEVGKTYVSALLARVFTQSGRPLAVYKPAASGCEGDERVSEDAVALWNAAGRPGTLEAVCPQRFPAPLAPNVAARIIGTTVDRQQIRDGLSAWAEFPFVLVEGVGGLMSPLSDHDLVVDLAVEFGYPLLIVAANELGVINQTLQTIAVARQYQLPIVGVVLNEPHPTATDDESRASNADELRRWTDVPVWGPLKYQQGPEELPPGLLVIFSG